MAISKAFQGCDEVSYHEALKCARERFPVNTKFMYIDHQGEAWLYKYVDVPCGHCDECRQAYAREWALRCMLEADHSHDCHFITLTYRVNPGSCRARDFQLFMKRLRKIVGPGVRVFGCQEYGTHFHRPHYHAILFNCPLQVDGFSSPELRKAWPFGFVMVGDVTKQSCAYVARYTAKKALTWKLPEGYEPPRLFMSRRPGIGESWIKDHLHEIYATDKVYFAVDQHNSVSPPPRYADKLLLKEDPNGLVILEDHKIRRQVSGYRKELSEMFQRGADHDHLLDAHRHLAEERSKRYERNIE